MDTPIWNKAHPTLSSREGITIVKVGGAVVEDEEQLRQLLQDFMAIEGPKILVHGGGRRATKMAERLGIETKMVEGRRITDADMLEVVTMVYGGLVNKHVVASLQALGADAIGLTGADGDIIRSMKRPLKNGIDFGFVGDVEQASGAKIAHFIDAGLIPVIAPLTHDGQGNMLNTNADTMASETAKAMAAVGYDVTLIFAFEKPGVLANPDDDASVISSINAEEFQRLKADGTISGGMLPKIENALAAIRAGVKQVIITSAQTISGHSGTVIS
jgi:acetylglutamate kinase